MKHLKISNPVVYEFLAERCTFSWGSECEPHDLFRAYQAYCEEAGQVPLSRHNFMTIILRDTEVNIRRKKNSTESILYNITLGGSEDG